MGDPKANRTPRTRKMMKRKGRGVKAWPVTRGRLRGPSGVVSGEGFRFGKRLGGWGPYPGSVCKSFKEKGLEHTELGSVYGKWEAWWDPSPVFFISAEYKGVRSG